MKKAFLLKFIPSFRRSDHATGCFGRSINSKEDDGVETIGACGGREFDSESVEVKKKIIIIHMTPNSYFLTDAVFFTVNVLERNRFSVGDDDFAMVPLLTHFRY